MNAIDVVRAWDKAPSRSRRIGILTAFLQRHSESTAAEIELDLGHGSMLFFTRITAWLRLTYKLGHELAVPLSALSLFLQGQRFLTNFMEIGGILMLAELVGSATHSTAFPNDKDSALLLLLHIANAGRVYREMICDCDGIDMLIEATVTESRDRTLELCSALFLALGQGNPRKAPAVHAALLRIMRHGKEGGALAAATALRALQLAKVSQGSSSEAFELNAGDSIDGGSTQDTAAAMSVLDAMFHLLTTPNVKLRFEGMELLSIASHNPTLMALVLRRCFEVMERPNLSIDDDPIEGQRVERLRASCGRVSCGILQTTYPGEIANERMFAVADRHAAHITLGRFLVSCAGRDIPAQLDCCKALRRLAIGPFVHMRGELPPTAACQWLLEAAGQEATAELLKTEVVEEGFVVRLCQSLSHWLDKSHERLASSVRGPPPATAQEEEPQGA